MLAKKRKKSEQAERWERIVKGIASLFTDEARAELDRQLGIVLSDDYDYSSEELSEMYDRIADDFPYAYGDNGAPLPMGRIFDSIIDIFVKKRLIEFQQ